MCRGAECWMPSADSGGTSGRESGLHDLPWQWAELHVRESVVVYDWAGKLSILVCERTPDYGSAGRTVDRCGNAGHDARQSVGGGVWRAGVCDGRIECKRLP